MRLNILASVLRLCYCYCFGKCCASIRYGFVNGEKEDTTKVMLLPPLFALAPLLCWCYEELSDSSLRRLGSLELGRRLTLNPLDTNNHFAHLNKTRVPGSEGSLYTREYIKSHFHTLNGEGSSAPKWIVEEDNFEQKGYNFSNIVVRSTAQASDGGADLIIAAHYDSLIRPEGFIGAIDSAVSCGIMMDVAAALTPLIQGDTPDMGLVFVFFDGEEAFEHWTPTDSIYGARHLHSQWKSTGELGSIGLFVLLDLLGSAQKGTNYVPSYFPQTHDSYNDMARIERRLHRVFPEIVSGNRYFARHTSYFTGEYAGFVEDDHLPFLRSGVPVLHLIPSTFPAVWHTTDDNFHNVDVAAAQRWAYILTTFILESLELSL